VQKRILPIAITTLLFSLIIIGCSKLDTTDIGSDLLPAVDNINTFDTLLQINTTQGVFNLDSTKVSNTDDHVLGKINNDPLFGTTTATIYAQFKPTFYPYYYGNANDTIVSFDSVVLCLSYKGNWGDSSIPLQLQVKEIPSSTGGVWDSLYKIKDINYAPATGNVLGNTTVNIASLGNYIKYANRKDSVKNQIRIKLSGSFVTDLFARDTNVLSNNSFRTDSAFKLFTKGMAITVISGNSLLYTNFADSTTKLEIHYRRKNGGSVDTTYSSFKVNTSALNATVKPSSSANNIVRGRTGYPVSSPSADEIYLQTSPGTYANLSIPALATISNRIIHRAEIIVEQIPFNTVSDNWFTAPNYLYLDLKDTGTTAKWKPIYFDLNPNVGYNPDNPLAFYPGDVDFIYHGGFLRSKTDVFGSPAKFYNFNITRYVQQIVTKHTTNYPLRLYAPYNIEYPQYDAIINFNNRLANGRVKVGSGTNTNYKMRLRLVYSKI